ncbi:allergin-1 [Protopterus annectens]|uniref:allergin-1 n=1 Tax=Protopterus annectens TaxID=7888 RepID=UPI001CFA7A0E|nr:allergin-1 [Protopterus annectens]
MSTLLAISITVLSLQSSANFVIQRTSVLAFPVSKPELSILQNTSEVLLGTSVKLLCRSPNGTDPIFYSLFKGEKFMKTASGSIVDGVQFNISILQESDYGAYQCKAENRAPNMSKYSEKRNITILVPVSTPQLQILPRISEVIIGEQVTLQCKAENGSLPITYTFFRGNEYLHNITASERQSVTYHLTFHKPENSGKYYCKAENSVPGKGQISNEETITVKDHIKMLTISLGVSLLVLIVIGITICFKCKSQTASSLCHRVSRKLHSDRVPLQIREEATDTTGGDYEVLGESTTSVLHHEEPSSAELHDDKAWQSQTLEGDANGNDVNYAILQLQERNSSSALVREVETDYTNIRPTVQDTSDVDHDYVNCDLSSAPNIRTKATEAEMDSPDYVNCCLQNTSNTEETEDGHSVIYSQVNKKQSKKQ